MRKLRQFYDIKDPVCLWLHEGIAFAGGYEGSTRNEGNKAERGCYSGREGKIEGFLGSAFIDEGSGGFCSWQRKRPSQSSKQFCCLGSAVYGYGYTFG